MRQSGSSATMTRTAHEPPYWSQVLRALREARGITQDGWAAWLSVSRKSVQRWENGETVPNADAERAIIAYCRDKALFRTFDRGPLRGVSVTPDWLEGLLAEARLGTSPAPPPIETASAARSTDSRPDEPHGTGTTPRAPPRAGATLVPTNLPVPLTSFVGREREAAQVERLLTTTRLLTLTGAGGVGKTRLAIELAREVVEQYPDGVWLVELASLPGEATPVAIRPLEEPGQVVHAVAGVLGVRETPGRPFTATLVDDLRPRSLLLVLDNCEHVVAACAELAETVLRACPNVQVLATSRQPLGITGETVWRVPSLSLPGRGPLPPIERLARVEAVQLFVERAAAARPAFTLTSRNVAVVAQLCRRLDGIPLAIELAAARVRALDVEQINDRLDERFRLLTGGSRAALPRQQTLQALIDWSHDLLTAPERVALRRLAVFAGGFDLEAAEVVCAGEGIAADEVLDLVTGLVDRSLVLLEEGRDGQARYRLLETIRQYALEKLRSAEEHTLLQERHRDWCLALAERGAEGLQSPAQGVWLERLEAEHDNLRAALDWSRTDVRGAEAGLRLAGSLWRFWYSRGYLSEGYDWLDQFLALTTGDSGSRPARAKALHGAGTLAYVQGQHERGMALYEQALALRRELGDAEGIARSLSNLGMVAQYLGDYERAAASFEEALDWSRGLGDEWLIAISLNNLGTLARDRADYERASALIEEALSVFRKLGDTRTVADLLDNLGHLACLRGDHERSASLCRESLALFRELNDKPGTNEALQNLGMVAHARGDDERAAVLFDESLALSRELNDKWGIARSLNGLAGVALHQDDHGRAVTLFEQGLQLYREVGYKQGVAASLNGLADAHQRQRGSRLAEALYREALVLCREVNDRLGLAISLEGLARTTSAQGNHNRAARLLGAAAALRETIGAPLSRSEQNDLERTDAAVRVHLERDAYAAAWAEGQALTAEQAAAYALTEGQSQVPAGPRPV